MIPRIYIYSRAMAHHTAKGDQSKNAAAALLLFVLLWTTCAGVRFVIIQFAPIYRQTSTVHDDGADPI